MDSLGIFRTKWTLLALLFAGCGSEKKPPTIEWIQPSSSAEWPSDASVTLEFVLSNPAPDRGQSAPANWRIDIGPSTGGVWWSSSGAASTSPQTGGVDAVDTVSTTWNTPAASNLPTGVTTLLLTATATDLEGAVGADFAYANLAGQPLTSSGFWFLENTSPVSLHHLPNGSSEVVTDEGPFESASSMVHLDGQATIMVGGQQLTAWSLPKGNNGPTLLWTTPPPLTPQTGPIRFVRRPSTSVSGPAIAEVGWADRVQWVSADGLILANWLLDETESLIDASIFGGSMVVLARTAANELRLISHDLDSGARLESITWTPEASGSMGPNGKAWLISILGDPAALESDGTFRRWFTEMDGNTGLASGGCPGSADVSNAGRLEDGRSWFSREGTWLVEENVPLQMAHPTPIQATAEDRANGITWVLESSVSGEAQTWMALDAQGWSPTGLPNLDVSGNMSGVGSSGSVAHNRPGPL